MFENNNNLAVNAQSEGIAPSSSVVGNLECQLEKRSYTLLQHVAASIAVFQKCPDICYMIYYIDYRVL